MKKRNINNTLFDLAVGPSLLVFLGVPALIVLIVIAIVIAAIILIRKTIKKNRCELNDLSQKDNKNS